MDIDPPHIYYYSDSDTATLDFPSPVRDYLDNDCLDADMSDYDSSEENPHGPTEVNAPLSPLINADMSDKVLSEENSDNPAAENASLPPIAPPVIGRDFNADRYVEDNLDYGSPYEYPISSGWENTQSPKVSLPDFESDCASDGYHDDVAGWIEHTRNSHSSTQENAAQRLHPAHEIYAGQADDLLHEGLYQNFGNDYEGGPYGSMEFDAGFLFSGNQVIRGNDSDRQSLIKNTPEIIDLCDDSDDAMSEAVGKEEEEERENEYRYDEDEHSGEDEGEDEEQQSQEDEGNDKDEVSGSVPWPGNIYKIFQKDTGCALGLTDGSTVECTDDPNSTANLWLIVENNGYLGLQNQQTGLYLSLTYTSAQVNYIATPSFADMGLFTTRAKPAGGYHIFFEAPERIVLVPESGNGEINHDFTEGNGIWEFVHVSSVIRYEHFNPERSSKLSI